MVRLPSPTTVALLLVTCTTAAQEQAKAPLGVRDATISQVQTEVIGTFRKGAGGAFKLQSYTSNTEAKRTSRSGVTSRQVTADELPDLGNPEYTFKLIPFEDTLFGKIQFKSLAFEGDSEVFITLDGNYEMQVTEGSLEEYEAGGALALQIAPRDRERYLKERLAAYEQPDFLAKWSTDYREGLLELLDAEIAKTDRTGALPVGVSRAEMSQLRERVVESKITATPSLSETPTTYRIEGDVMTSETAEITLSMKLEAR